MTQRLPALLLAALAACTGSIGGSGRDDGDNRPGDDDDGAPLTPPTCDTVGPRMVRRLTAIQLRNSLVDLFRDPGVPDGQVLTDPVVHGFRVDATQAVIRDLDAQQILGYAERVATWAVQQKLGELTSCRSQDAACRRAFIESFGGRVYREPVPAASAALYDELFAAEPSFEAGAEAVIAAMIQSPYFLYRRELGAESGGGYALTAHEVASNLAFTLTDRPPDDALLAAADDGRLASAADLEREVERLLASAGGADALGHFLREWLEVDDLATVAKVDPQNQLDANLRRSMAAESEALFVDLVRSDGSLGDLLTATYTFVDQALASFYQVGGGGGGLQRIDLPAGTRAPGILGHASVLTRHALSDSSSPVQRGKLIRERFLCEELVPPPPEVEANLTVPTAGLTTRERYLEHSRNDTCAGCHALTDPIGFAFEGFDGVGRRRDQDNGKPVDTSGRLVGMPEGDVPLDGLASLAGYLATSDDVHACSVRYLSYYAYGVDECNPEAVLAAAPRGSSLRDVIAAIVTAPHFTRRQAVP
jgi:hypothetical protein